MTDAIDHYTLYGAPASLYSGKARSYLRAQGIGFVEAGPGSDRYLNEIVPTVGRWIIPCMETPDGTIIQDGADIIDHFERGPGQSLRRYTAYPTSPLLLAVAHVFELFGGEGLLRPAMHYRWNFDDENLAFLTSEFALFAPPNLSAEEAEQVFLHSSGRMRKAAAAFGVTPESQPLIETAFHEWLDLFEAHLVDHPYLLGNRPTIGDYGLIAAMWAHLYRDPAPTMVVKQRAPRVGRWVERMTTTEPYRHEYDGDDDDLIAGDVLPATLIAMLRYVSEEYLPEISAHVAVANEWLAEHPEREFITRRYLRFASLHRPALDRLADGDAAPDDEEDEHLPEDVDKHYYRVSDVQKAFHDFILHQGLLQLLQHRLLSSLLCQVHILHPRNIFPPSQHIVRSLLYL